MATSKANNTRADAVAFASLPAVIRKHCERVGKLSEFLYRKVIEVNPYPYDESISEDNLPYVNEACKLHDIGKAVLSKECLKKSNLLNVDQVQQLREHVVKSSDIFMPIIEESSTVDPMLVLAVDAALNHHENWDGTGYPSGWAGEDIPIIGRIVAITDAYDNLRNGAKLDSYQAMDQINQARGTMFDPLIVDIFKNNERTINSIFNQLVGSKSKAKSSTNEVERLKPIEFVYQPLFGKVSKDVKMVYCELILNDRDNGTFFEKDYYDVADSSSKIFTLQDFATKEFCKFVIKFISRYSNDVVFALRGSRTIAKRAQSVEKLVREYKEAGIQISSLCFNFTPSDKLVDYDLQHIRNAGIKIMLDCSMYKDLPFTFIGQYKCDYIKLDANMFNGELNTDRQRGVMQAFLELCNKFNIVVIMDNIKDHQTIENIKPFNFDLVSGSQFGNAVKTVNASFFKMKGGL